MINEQSSLAAWALPLAFLLTHCANVQQGAIGTGGAGGNAGTAGNGGSGGSSSCERDLDCDDENECTVDQCQLSTGSCSNMPLPDDVMCATGACQAGQCDPIGSTFPCTEQGLVDAIAEGGGPHAFECSGPTTITTTTEITIDNDVVLDGLDDLTVNGDNAHRVFSVSGGVTVELRRMSISGGRGESTGGGILSSGAMLTLRNCTVSGSTSTGGLFGGAGGGVYNGDGATLALIGSTVSDNTAGGGGGIHNASGAVMTVVNSAVSDNTSVAGGAISNDGTMSLTNSTLSGNVSGGGSAIFCSGGMISLTHSTVSNNTATSEQSGGVSVWIDGGTLTVTSSIIEGDCESPSVISGGHNIESPGNTCRLSGIGDEASVSAGALNLGPLEDNGGPTLSHEPRGGSRAIDVIDEIDCTVVNDQRGQRRPQGTACDVGAVEVVP